MSSVRHTRLLPTMLVPALALLAAVMALPAQPVTATDGPPRRNLGPRVNGLGAEILPIVSVDGRVLYFDRKFDSANTGGVEDPDDICFAWLDESGQWEDAQNAGSPPNTHGSDALLWISAHGDHALIFSETLPSPRIGLTHLRDGKWITPQPIQIEGITSLGETYYATITPDERHLILALRADSINPENLDLYVANAVKLDLSSWGRPTPLSPVVNTSQFEGAPFVAWDNRTLYYSSTRIGGQGGGDIWMSRRIGDSWASWTTPVNLGQRINTPGLEESMTLPWFVDSGFVSSLGEYGQADLFTVRIADDMLPTPTVVVSGRFLVRDEPTKGLVRALRTRDGLEVASTTSAMDGTFRFFLAPGEEYAIVGWAPGVGEIVRNVDATDQANALLECELHPHGADEE